MNIYEEYHITVFGDSIGKGVYTEGDKTGILRNSAVKLFEKEYNIEIDNRSAYGQTLKKFKARNNLEKYLEGLDRSENALNIAVIELGGNDADFKWAEVGKNPHGKHNSVTDVEDFSRTYGDMIQRLKAENVKVVTCTIVPISSKRYFNNVISKIADKDGVLEFFNGDFDTIHRHQEMFNNEILKNSYLYGAKVIDIRKNFLNSTDFESLMCMDGIHPNADGQSEIYGAVEEFLAS